MVISHSTVAIIGTDHLKNNFRLALKKVFPAKVIPVVKANAYGHGLEQVAKICEESGAEKLAVAHTKEGVFLRKKGIRIPILVMGAIPDEQLEEAVREDLICSIVRIEQLKNLDEICRSLGKKISVHLKFDTGMGRIGISPEEIFDRIDRISDFSAIKIAGLYSHFACADTPEHPLNRQQKEKFKAIVNRFEQVGYRDQEKHLCNSAGVLYHSDSYYDAVRFGISLYGVAPGKIALPKEYKPVMSLRTKINFVKIVKKGTPISYGATWLASEDCRIATLPLGYGDGFFCAFSGHESLCEIQGKRFPVVGKICMDLCMINLGKERFSVGETVDIFGAFGKTRTEELAKKINTIPYEILTNISQRVPRIYY